MSRADIQETGKCIFWLLKVRTTITSNICLFCAQIKFQTYDPAIPR